MKAEKRPLPRPPPPPPPPPSDRDNSSFSSSSSSSSSSDKSSQIPPFLNLPFPEIGLPPCSQVVARPTDGGQTGRFPRKERDQVRRSRIFPFFLVLLLWAINCLSPLPLISSTFADRPFPFLPFCPLAFGSFPPPCVTV